MTSTKRTTVFESDDPLTRLLLAWQESVEAGKPLSAATLCTDDPELISELEREIALLQNLDRFMLAPQNFSHCETVDASTLVGPARPVPDRAEFEIPGFEILEEVGRGGMGVVYKARQKRLQRIVAIKTLASSRWAQPGFVARLRREARALSQLNDPHVVQVFDVVDTPTSISLVLEYVEGGNLASRLKGMPLSPSEAAKIALTLARTMSVVHQQGLYHRDIKPANVLIDRTGDIKIADFGLAKEEGAPGAQTATGEFFGTPSYMAPEQARGRKTEVNAGIDVYAIGATLYEMLTGRPPFTGASTIDILQQLLDRDPIAPRLLIPGIPRDLETICLKCLEKDPQKRFGSALELADELERTLQGRPIRSRPVGMADRLLKWCRRRPAAAGLIGLSITATVIILTLIASYYQSLKKYNEDLVTAATRASVLQRIAEENERRAKDSLYASDISRAAVAWKQEDIRDLTDVLERHRPGPGEVDRRGFEWWYLHRQANLAKRVLLDTGTPLYTVCYSSDKKWLIAAGKGAIVRFLDPDTGALWKEFPTGQKEVNGVALSPDGSELATAGDDGTIRIWNIETAEERLKIATPFRKVFELVYIGNGTRIAACGISPIISLFETRSGLEISQLIGHTNVVESLMLDDVGQTLISISNDNSIKFWNLEDGTLKTSIEVPDFSGTMIYLRNRGFLITGNPWGILRTIDVKQNREIDAVKQIDGVGQIALHPNGELLAVGDANGGIRLRRISSEGRFVDDDFQPWRAHQSKIYSLFWSTDGSRLISSGKDGFVLSWSLEAAQRLEPRRFSIDRPAQNWPVEQISSLVTKRKADGAFMRWNLHSGRLPTPSHGRFHGDPVTSSDGKLFAAVNQAESVQLFAVPTDPDLPIDSQLVAEWPSPNRLSLLGFTADSQKLVAFERLGNINIAGESEESHAIIFDVPSLACFDRVLQKSLTRCLAIAPDGRRMVLALTDNMILWDILEKKIVWTVPQINVLKVAFSPNGNLIATASTNRAIVIRNTFDGEIQNQITNLRMLTTAIVFSPDSRTLVSSMHDGAVIFTHVATGQELLKIEHVGSVYRFEFAEGGRYLICYIAHNRIFPPEDAAEEIVVLNSSDPTEPSSR